MKAVINGLDIGTDCYKISVINMGENIIEEFYLDTYSDRISVLNAVDFIVTEGSPVDISEALRIARSVMFNQENGDRETAPNVAVLVTHSSPIMDISDIREETSSLKGSGSVMFPIIMNTEAEFLAQYQSLSSGRAYFLSFDSTMTLSDIKIRYVLDILQNIDNLTQTIESQKVTESPPQSLPRESKDDDIDQQTLIIIRK